MLRLWLIETASLQTSVTPSLFISEGVATWQSSGEAWCKSNQIQKLRWPEYFANPRKVGKEQLGHFQADLLIPQGVQHICRTRRAVSAVFHPWLLSPHPDPLPRRGEGSHGAQLRFSIFAHLFIIPIFHAVAVGSRLNDDSLTSEPLTSDL